MRSEMRQWMKDVHEHYGTVHDLAQAACHKFGILPVHGDAHGIPDWVYNEAFRVKDYSRWWLH